MGPRCGVLTVLGLLASPLGADDGFGPLRAIESAQGVCFKGELFPSNSDARNNISAVAVVNDRLLVGADEGRALQVLDPTADGCYAAGREIARPAAGAAGDEADIEGIARDGDTIWAIGSHSARRKKVEAAKTAAKNRERMEDVEAQASRRGLFRIRGLAGERVDSTSLSAFLSSHAILGRFTDVPSKENGIDIEGLAVDERGRLYVGFRGPVLRQNFVPVVRLAFPGGGAIADFTADVLFVNLDGHGIRDLVRVHGGFLILSGPVGDAPPEAALYFWDGRDGLPDQGQVAPVTFVAHLPAPDGGSAEGLTLLREDAAEAASWDLLVVYDGVMGGAPVRLKVRKPR